MKFVKDQMINYKKYKKGDDATEIDKDLLKIFIERGIVTDGKEKNKNLKGGK